MQTQGLGSCVWGFVRGRETSERYIFAVRGGGHTYETMRSIRLHKLKIAAA